MQEAEESLSWEVYWHLTLEYFWRPGLARGRPHQRGPGAHHWDSRPRPRPQASHATPSAIVTPSALGYYAPEAGAPLSAGLSVPIGRCVLLVFVAEASDENHEAPPQVEVGFVKGPPKCSSALKLCAICRPLDELQDNLKAMSFQGLAVIDHEDEPDAQLALLRRCMPTRHTRRTFLLCWSPSPRVWAYCRLGRCATTNYYGWAITCQAVTTTLGESCGATWSKVKRMWRLGAVGWRG